MTGHVVAWGDNTYGQTNLTTSTAPAKLIAAGDGFTLASKFAPLVQYQVDVAKDLLLIYNSNSAASSDLCVYYLDHRPMVSNANVIGIACDVGEFTTSNKCDAEIVGPVLNWLMDNPTKHPGYVVLFYDVPTRLWVYPSLDQESVSYHLRDCYPGWKPFVTHINAETSADCEAYVDKLEYIASNYGDGGVVISASARGYGNTNYVLDGIRKGYGWAAVREDFTSRGDVVARATSGLAAARVAAEAIWFMDGTETLTNGVFHTLSHPTNHTNLAGYVSWGYHSSLGGDCATNRSLHWAGNSRWWVMETIESFNGQRAQAAWMGNFMQWFSSGAFGGSNYSSTPVGAVSYTEEPGVDGVNDTAKYFGLWAAGKRFAIAAWESRVTKRFQVIGDPLVAR